MAFAYLLDPEHQYMTKSGTINVAGVLRVYDAATDDPVITYKDFNGTENEFDIVLDNNGRAVVIADSDRAYRLEVYDRYGSLMWTTQPIWCLAAGGGGVVTTNITSTNGSIEVDKITVGSTTTYDLGVAPRDNDEFLEWIDAGATGVGDGKVNLVYGAGTMSTYGDGIGVSKDHLYHITTHATVTPTGAGIDYDTFTMSLSFTDGDTTTQLVTRSYDIDSSVTEPVEVEFSYDLVAPADGFVFVSADGTTVFSNVDMGIQVHRIYSGVAAVPDHFATKDWVSANYEPQSAMSGYVQYSALSGESGMITSISGSAVGNTAGHEYSGIWPVNVDNTADLISVDHKTLAVDETMTGYQSGSSAIIGVNTSIVLSSLSDYQPTSAMTAYQSAGDYAFNSSLSSKMDASESSSFYPYTGNPSGFLTSHQSLAGYATEAYVDSSVSSKLDATASSEFYPYSGNPSGFLTAHQSLSAYATESYVDSSVSSKLDATASSQFLTSLPADLAYTSDVASAVSGKMDSSASSSFYPMTSNPSGYLTAHQSLAGYATVEYVDSSVSSKLDSSAYDSSLFYPMSGNPSSFLVTDDISGKMDVSAMTAYQSAGDYADASALSSKLDASASSQFVTSLAGYATEAYVDSSVSSKLDATASSQFITSTAGLQPAGDYAFNSSLSSKMDASESSSFYPMDSNPSGYLTAHQSLAGYATESYVDSSVSSKLDATASSQFITSLSGYATEEYVDSSVSAKLDATASSQFITSLAGYATETYVDSSVSSKLDATASSQFITSLDGYATETYVDSSVSSKMDASESSAFYPMDSNPSGYLTAHQSLAGYATTTYVDSSVSSKLDTTAQVVSATATQLYAGTAYLTSVNGAPISATRAGNATNAINATSAWYDSNGRYLTSLQSQLTFGYSGTAISSIDGSALVGGGGGGGKTYSGIAPIIVDNTADTISVSSMELVCDSSMSAYESAGQKVLMVSTALFGTAIY